MENPMEKLLRLVKEGVISKEFPLCIDSDEVFCGSDDDTEIFQIHPKKLLRNLLDYLEIPWDDA